MSRTNVSVMVFALLVGWVGAGAGPLSPFTEEALGRGLSFTMPPPFPQPQGSFGQGAGFADLDNDGDPDIIVMGSASGVVGIFENTGGGNFVDRSSTSGIPTFLEHQGFAAADFDGDGLVDVYITQSANKPNVLLRNDGNFAFTDVTATALVSNGSQFSTGPTWGDYNADGWLDLYVSNYGLNNTLYKNNANSTFSNVTFGVGAAGDSTSLTFLTLWTDYDRDGDLDLYQSNDRAAIGFPPNALLRNDGGTFTDASVGSGANVSIYSMGIGAGDFDNSGYTDIYLTDIHTFENNGAAADYYGLNPLLINQGNGSFQDETTTFETENEATSWAAVMFDWDNDGRKDLYVANQWLPNHFFHCPAIPCVEIGSAMQVTGDFDPVFDLFSDPQDLPEIAAYVASVADVDGDGDIDVLVNNLGSRAELFINNEGTKRNWVRMNLVGEYPNLHAVGAGVETTVLGTVQFNEIYAGANGYLGQNEYTVHVGLDQAEAVDQAIVRWPSGGPTRTLTGLPANTVWTIYPPSRLCDFEGNGVDYADFVVFADDCFLEPFAPGCEMMDFDGDSAVATDDLSACFVTAANDCNGNGTEDVAEIALDLTLDGDQDFDIDCCDAGPVLEPNPVGNTLFLGRFGSGAQLTWTAPATDPGHGAASGFYVFASVDSIGDFTLVGGTATPSFNDSTAGNIVFYVVGSANDCGTSGEEPL